MLKLVVLVASLALAYGENPEIGLGSFWKNHPKIPIMPKIVNGVDAKLGEFPYQVSLQLAGPLAKSHFCGGSLVSPSTVITAGHCVTEVNVGPLQHIEVVAGIVSLKDRDNGQISKVLKTIVNPEFPGGVGPNDIAIHILSTPFSLNDNVGLINLPQNGTDPSGDVILTGWGSTSHTQIPSMPDKLQKTELPIVPYDECNQVLEGQDTPFNADMVCTGPLSGGYGACSGDSGGPLVSTGGNQTTLVGIVSWGFIPCGQSGVPSVFTKVSSFLDFINENIV